MTSQQEREENPVQEILRLPAAKKTSFVLQIGRKTLEELPIGTRLSPREDGKQDGRLLGVASQVFPGIVLGPRPIKCVGVTSQFVIHGFRKEAPMNSGSILADGRAVFEDRAASSHRHARQGAGRRPARHQRHRSCAEIRRALGRCAAGIRTQERRSTIATSDGRPKACGSTCSMRSLKPAGRRRRFSSTLRR